MEAWEYWTRIALCAAAAFGLIWFVFWFAPSYGDAKRQVLRALPSRLDHEPARPEDYPGLDHDALRRYTAALEGLGFTRLLDYTTRTDLPHLPDGFGRLLVHPAHHCFAEVNQVFPWAGDPVPMRCMIGSLLAEGWNLATTDREMNAVNYVLRRPRSLWSSLPGTAPEDLLADHLDQRRQVANDLSVAVRTDLTAETYIAHDRQEMADRRAVLLAKPDAVVEAEMGAFRPGPGQWLGDYAPIREERDRNL